MSRKIRSDSNTTAGAMLRAGLPEPPDHIDLPAETMPFWWSVVGAKAADSWTPPDLELAAELARTKADLERLRREIAEEGDIIEGKISPRRKLEESLVTRAIRLTRALQVHALATVGRSGDQRQRNQAARDARDVADGIDDDDLIAPPTGEVH